MKPKSQSFLVIPVLLAALAGPAPARAQVDRPGDEATAPVSQAAETPTADPQAGAVKSPDPAPAEAAPAEAAPATELERRIEVLAAELERLRLGEVAPRAEQGRYGLGPAASKVYAQDHGVSLGGYGELLYQNTDGDPAKFDFYRSILYAGYKFNDRFVLNTEIEIEHVKEVFLEFAYLDWLWRPELNVRAGLMLIPMGLINEIHEPTTFLGALRPETERRILPSTWRENGVGVFGDVGPVSYRLYGVTGFDATGFGPDGLRGGRQKGAKALSDDFAGVARVDLTAIPGVLLGGSVYYGEADQSQLDGPVSTFLYEAHADVQWRGLSLRGLFAGAQVGGVTRLNDHLGLTGADSVGEVQQGWYVQAGYDVLLPFGLHGLVPYVRYEHLDTQVEVPEGFSESPATELSLLSVGAAWYPIDQIVLKAEYQDRGDDPSRFNAVLGYIF